MIGRSLISFTAKLLCALLLIAPPFSGFCQNPIPAENSLTGNPSSEWDITGAGDLSLQGFATDISVNKEQTVNFKITITGANKNYSIASAITRVMAPG